MNNLTRALEAWREIVGPEHVLTDPLALSAAGIATFATPNRVPDNIRPGDQQEVRACVRVANEHRTPIYPVSTGKNWGYGSRVPHQSGSVHMEPYRLKRSP
jgi:4-cresol dehydrogenase (hydroxylating)